MDECPARCHRRKNGDEQHGHRENRTTTVPRRKPRREYKPEPAKTDDPQKEFVEAKNRSAQLDQHPRRLRPGEFATARKVNITQELTDITGRLRSCSAAAEANVI